MNQIASANGWWTITEDHVEQGKNVGVCGPKNCDMSPELIANDPAAMKFIAKDDDGNLYYAGFCILPHGLTSDAFAPLDDFAGPNAGATEIKYRMPNGTWKTL